MRKPPYSWPYCLYCYAPMRRFDGASLPCDECGRPNLRADFRLFWTHERRIREWETLLKLLVGILVGGLTTLALLYPGIGWGRGHGMGMGAPLLLGVILWDVASITRRERIYHFQFIGPIVGGLFGLVALLTLPSALDFGTPIREIYFVVLAVCSFLLAAPLVSRAWRHWCVHYVLVRQKKWVLPQPTQTS